MWKMAIIGKQILYIVEYITLFLCINNIRKLFILHSNIHDVNDIAAP